VTRLRLLALTALVAAPAAAQPVPRSPVDYGKSANWLCLPGEADSCARPLSITALNPSGYGSSGLSPVAKDPPLDCFIVYPTVSRDEGLNSDLNPGEGEEKAAVEAQFARFAGVCRTFVPIYRSMTIGAVTAAAAGADVTEPAMIAYADVRNAWRSYLAHHNQGRPFVLLGHSQGSLLLIKLLADEIEGRPEAKRMVRAILPGFNVMVPQGKLVGGSFKSTPLCSKADDIGCVMSWVSYRDRNAPPEGAFFGYSDQPGMTVGCTNPAKPGSTGWEQLDSFWPARSAVPVPGGPIIWSSEGPPPTPWLRTEGLASARCVNDGPRGYLSIRTNADPADKRTDRIGGEVGALGFFLPGWGMHLIDMNVAQGDLIRQLDSLGARARTGPRPAR